MKTYHLTFNLEADGAWYIEFPGYPFAHHNLMMVAGADGLCQYIAEKEGHPEKAVVDVTTGSNFLQSRMPDITMERFKMGYGASYYNSTPDGSEPVIERNGVQVEVSEAWLCPVTLLVLHRYPERINIYIPESEKKTTKSKQ